ncbi:MAG: DUF4124 domain-containing protein [Candidatus Nitrotoga sp.]
MKPLNLLIFLCVGYTSLAQAEIYKKVDGDGHVTYSSEPTKGSKKLDLASPNIIPPPVRARNNATPSDFHKVDSATQKSRDNLRRQILEEELSIEQRLVEEARQNLITEKETSEALKDKDGKYLRNVAKHEEKLKVLQWQVTLHEKNVEALKTELLKIK